MDEYVKISKELFAPFAELVRIGLFKDEKDALRSILLEHAGHKIAWCKSEIVKLEQKYGVAFKDFKATIDKRKDEEVYSEWDDFIKWESYEEALKYWTEVEERIKAHVI
ncbi:MAG: hypothetical protein ACP5E9_10200 [Candidatus Methanospirareceae archaeon]